jgi:antitoxin component of MazEF toxin-antitoxin module
MQFKAKLRKIGNARGIYIPAEVITSYNTGDIIELEVITSKVNEVKEVITPNSAHNKPKYSFDLKTGIYRKIKQLSPKSGT